jgi:putative transposase
LNGELILQQDYDYRQEAKAEIIEWIEIFYNRVRRHTKLGNITAVEAFNNYMLKAA